MFHTDPPPENAAMSWDPADQRWIASEADAASGPAAAGPLRSLILRPWRATDLDRFRALLDDPEVWRYLPETYPDPLDRELAADLIALSNEAPHHVVRAAVVDGAPVGQVRLAFDPGDSQRRRAEIGYWLGRAYWGQRLASDMVMRFSAQGFAMVPTLEQQVARVHRANIASRNILERCGFTDQGPCAEHPQFDMLVRNRLRVS